MRVAPFSRLLWVLLAALLPPADARSAPEETTQFLLPAGVGVTARWVLPPQQPAQERRWREASFAVAAGESVWLGLDGELVANPSKEIVFRTKPDYSGFAALTNGAVVFCAGQDLRIVARLARPELDKAGTPIVLLQPAVTVPVRDCRLFPSDGEALYVSGRNAETGKNEVYRLAPEAGKRGFSREITRVLSTEREVSGVAGDGSRTFVASGPLVMEIVPGSDSVKGLFLHPKGDVKGLAFSKEGALFYATDSAVGLLAAKGPFDFLKVSEGRIAARDSALFVLEPRSLGILRIDGLEVLKRL